jgi:hypothetical protein
VKVQCERCAVIHEIEPPPWIIASGRPFDLQCPACGHRQKARPGVGIQLVSTQDDASFGELDSGTSVRESLRPVASRAGARSGISALESPSSGLTRHEAARNEAIARAEAANRTATRARPTAPFDDELLDADPRESYRRARDESDITVADEPLWRGRVETLEDVPPAFMQLRQGIDVFDVADLATLQRWIMERRIDPEDELSDGDGGWIRAGDRSDLAVFFAAVERLESLELGGPTAHPSAPRRPILVSHDDTDEDDHTVESAVANTEELPIPGREAPPRPIAQRLTPAPIQPDEPSDSATSAATVVEHHRGTQADRTAVKDPDRSDRVTVAKPARPTRTPPPPPPNWPSGQNDGGLSFSMIAVVFVLFAGAAGIYSLIRSAAEEPKPLTLPSVAPAPKPEPPAEPPRPATDPRIPTDLAPRTGAEGAPAAPTITPPPAAVRPPAPQEVAARMPAAAQAAGSPAVPAPTGPAPTAPPPTAPPPTAPPPTAPPPAKAPPVTPDAQLGQAQRALAGGDLKGAAAAARSVLAADTDNARAHLLLGTVLHQQGSVDAARDHLCAASGRVGPDDETRIGQLLAKQQTVCPSLPR